MGNEDNWKAAVDKGRTSGTPSRVGVLNIALLFGTAAIALTLILTPMLSSQSTQRRVAATPMPDPYDNITTGSIKKQDGPRRYTIRRSVLQEQPGAVCIVDGYGAKGPGC